MRRHICHQERPLKFFSVFDTKRIVAQEKTDIIELPTRHEQQLLGPDVN